MIDKIINLLSRLAITILLIISIIELFLPWFFFSRTVDYRSGLECMNFGTIMGYLGSLVSNSMMFIRNGSVDVEMLNFLCMILIVLSFIYEFLIWNIEATTGSVNLRISIDTAHCNHGFYVTLISISLAGIVYIYNLMRKGI